MTPTTVSKMPRRSLNNASRLETNAQVEKTEDGIGRQVLCSCSASAISLGVVLGLRPVMPPFKNPISGFDSFAQDRSGVESEDNPLRDYFFYFRMKSPYFVQRVSNEDLLLNISIHGCCRPGPHELPRHSSSHGRLIAEANVSSFRSIGTSGHFGVPHPFLPRIIAPTSERAIRLTAPRPRCRTCARLSPVRAWSGSTRATRVHGRCARRPSRCSP